MQNQQNGKVIKCSQTKLRSHGNVAFGDVSAFLKGKVSRKDVTIEDKFLEKVRRDV